MPGKEKKSSKPRATPYSRTKEDLSPNFQNELSLLVNLLQQENTLFFSFSTNIFYREKN